MPNTILKNPVQVDVTASAVGLHVTGSAAAPTAGSGAPTSNALTIEGATGQETTGTAGETAGDGAAVSITAGTGGAAPGGSTNGAGGSVTINPGPPGTGAGTAGSHGNVLLATAGGSIGVGTTSPTAKLEVAGQVKITGGAPGTNKILTSDSAGLASWTNPTFSSQWVTSGSNISYGNGNVGIGTTTPGAYTLAGRNYLTLRGSTAEGVLELTTAAADADLNNVGVLQFTDKNSTWADKRIAVIVGNLSGSTANNRGGYLRFHTKADGGDMAERMRMDNAGNVGIGTTSPTSALSFGTNAVISRSTVDGSDNGSLSISGAGNLGDTRGGHAKFFGNEHASTGRVELVAGNVTGGTIDFWTNNALKMTLDRSGKVGIGTQAPGSTLHVNGGVQVGTPTGGDKGTGSINVSGDIYKNGAPMLERLEEAHRTILALTKRVEQLEASGKEKR